MRLIASLALIVASSLAADDPASAADEPKGDLAKLQGSWTAKVGPNKDISTTLSIRDSAVEITWTRPNGDDFKLKSEIKLDDKASPKTIDWDKFTDPQGNEAPGARGIYKFDGDSWTVCSASVDEPRPTEFKAGEGGPPMLTTWTRVKSEEKPIAGDLGKFQGSWNAKGGANDDVKITLTIKVNAITAHWVEGNGDDLELKGELRVNDQANPRTVDFFHFKKGDGEEVQDSLGIYTIEGDKITICIGGPGGERPTEFKAGTDGPPTLFVFTRKKD